eukprot:COSAG06_NODE_1003_length_11130_cov_5.230804_8_plen_119_part_00
MLILSGAGIETNLSTGHKRQMVRYINGQPSGWVTRLDPQCVSQITPPSVCVYGCSFHRSRPPSTASAEWISQRRVDFRQICLKKCMPAFAILGPSSSKKGHNLETLTYSTIYCHSDRA